MEPRVRQVSCLNELMMRTLLVLIALTIAGCGEGGPKLVKAGGAVRYNSAPLAEADVVFVPDAGGLPSIGRTDQEGRYTLQTNGRPGAPIGVHKVSVTAVRQKRAVPPGEAVGMTSEQIYANHETLIPVKYNNLITSGLSATVSDDAAKNEFAFDLK
jgi:hypothetical protein